MPDFPFPGVPAVVWHERPPTSTPRDPHETVVDHVGPKTFTVEGSDATFSRSTGRSKTIRSGGELTARTFIAVAADSDRGQAVLGGQRRRDAENDAVAAVQAWLTGRGEQDRVRGRGRAPEARRSDVSEPRGDVYRCIVDGCRWSMTDNSPDFSSVMHMPWAISDTESVGDAALRITREDAAKREAEIEKHLRSHPLEDYVFTIARLRDELARQRAGH